MKLKATKYPELYFAYTPIICCCLATLTLSDPQTNLLILGCSKYNVTSLTSFNNNYDATVSDLKSQISNGSYFATAQQSSGSDPVHALIQCREYMTKEDCLSCFQNASVELRNCSYANGGRVLYDGCYFRYERNYFYGEGTNVVNTGFCGKQNESSTMSSEFGTNVLALLSNLELATPKTKTLYAASTQDVASINVTIYAIAQCVQTVDNADCLDCLKVAYNNLQRCPPDSDGRAVDSGCFMRYSNKAFFAMNQSMNLAPYLKTGSSNKAALIGGLVGGGVGLILIIIAVLVWYRISRKKANPRADILDATQLRGPSNYRYKDLKLATGNFKDDNKLGEGGFGDVYKGTLKNGKIVAVKKLALSQTRRTKSDFASEVTLISNVHHRNLVRLLGCCNKGPELLLVYEYMANSSLDRILFGQKRRSLNWKQRCDIILGTAQGLAYLHEQFHVCIIHRDIKSSNILLDDNFQAKISDFGLARLMPENQSHISTKFAGTLGYTAPEYAIHGQLSEKVDTYSYGIVVLEIVSGKKNTEMLNDPAAEYLLKRAWRLYESGLQLELVDKSLDPMEYEIGEMKKIIEIALMCTQSSPTLRPTMPEVVVMLKHRGDPVRRKLTRPPFIDSTEQMVTKDKSTSTASSASNANISISQVSGR